jgi:hypothetical protein
MIEWQGTPKNSEKSWRNATLWAIDPSLA